jgi:flagellar protein FliS
VYTPSSVAAKAYARVDLESGVMGASPHRLIVLLYEGAELSIRMAIKHIHEGDLMKKSAAITKASSIIHDGLREALDHGQGGEIAQQLDALYDYMGKRIMLAHLRNETAPLEEVLGLLRELREAWQQIGAAPRQSTLQTIAA